MGQLYRAALERRIQELGTEHLRVYVNLAGLDPEYQHHLLQVLDELSVQVVSQRDSANFIFEGYCEPMKSPGKVYAFIRDRRLQFSGNL